jgi:hypothetical protein
LFSELLTISPGSSNIFYLNKKDEESSNKFLSIKEFVLIEKSSKNESFKDENTSIERYFFYFFGNKI